ncbi:MAG: trypsin-like peptidase domain-containing protein [Patescibacteria group bacterium]|nr:trypsin-like peptidase domain-containing protein [Patescibacteria group bacterium]MDD5294360.1 trypsin-like peptidase domain-containing protein [Patescibacteria group bacterium]MDD5554196.1 trypsin-like peptidase domain-containing protein [Patescibacteria group bacterium]
MENNFKKTFITIIVSSMIVSSVFGGAMGFWAGTVSSAAQFNLFSWLKGVATGQPAGSGLEGSANQGEKIVKVEEESGVITAAEKVSPAVVSIIISKDLPTVEQYYNNSFGDDFLRQFFGDNFDELFGPNANPPAPKQKQNGTTKQEIGGGTGFIVSSDGYIVTNKHVVLDEEAEYTVLMNDETKHEAKVLARDPATDLAVLKIEPASAKASAGEGEKFPTVELGDSSNLKVGQTVIAIGNALGEFRNTVSTGVISGLSRSITAGGIGLGSEQLSGVIQTDASINSGNSGGPLLNLAGQVIGINTAIAQNAQNIGFAIPINDLKDTIESVKKNGRIVRPWLGVRYVLVDKSIADANKLSVDYGALIVRGENRTDLAVIPGSPADKAGLAENDIILEVNGKKIDANNPLSSAIGKFKVGDEITLKILHKGENKEVKVKLEEMKN